jgi:hypothetical protein
MLCTNADIYLKNEDRRMIDLKEIHEEDIAFAQNAPLIARYCPFKVLHSSASTGRQNATCHSGKKD